MDRPPPFAFVTPDQQVQPFGKSLAPKHAHPHSFNLRVDDIAGAKPKEHCFATSPRLTNPLEPRYLLPHSNYVQPGPPVQRFTRNAIDVSDIPGAQVACLNTMVHCCEQEYHLQFQLCTAKIEESSVCHCHCELFRCNSRQHLNATRGTPQYGAGSTSGHIQELYTQFQAGLL